MWHCDFGVERSEVKVTWSIAFFTLMVPVYTGEQRHMFMNNLPRVVTWSGTAGTRIYDLAVASPMP